MSYVTSRDGTRIAYSAVGSGPALILVDGAMCFRASGPMGPIADALSADFTVYTYDRRGRGESGDTPPHSVDREVEDIAALVAEAGGQAFVFGISSGAALALEAANRNAGIARLALYEAPFVVDDTEEPLPDDFRHRLERSVAEGRRGAAVKLFMKRVRVPGPMIFVMQFTGMWKTLTGIAHTLPYDIALVEDHSRGKPLPASAWTNATMPTLVMDGGKSPRWMRNSQAQIARVLADARHQTLPGQTHMVKTEAIAPALASFFKERAA